MLTKLVFLALMTGAVAGCNSDVLGAGTPSNPATEMFAPSLGVDIASFARTESGVYYKDLRVGTGEVAAAGDSVTITYAGYLKDGKQFASQTTPTKQPLAIFIPGFRDGIIGMRVGGVRKLVIPSALAYGWQGNQLGAVKIPRNATLIYDVELFAVAKPAPTTP